MSRLEKIRRLFEAQFDGEVQCECEQCVAGRELLAVVQAERAGWRPSEKASALRVLANEEARGKANGSLQKSRAEILRQRADAWDALA